MLKANAHKQKRHQRGGNIFKKIAKMGDRLNKRYSGIAKMTGADKVVKAKLKKSLPTIESKLSKAGVSAKVIKPLSKEINKKLGGAYVKIGKQNQVGEGIIKDALTRLYAMISNKDPYDVGVDKKKEKDIYNTIYKEQEQGERDKKARQRELKRKADEERRALFDKMSFGSGCGCVEQVGTGWFDDMISTLAVLPIPGISCIARTVAVVKTAVDVATSDHPAKAFGGVVGDLAETVDKIAPPFLKEFSTPGKEYVKAIGFGAISPADTTKMLKVGVNHLDALLDNIVLDTLPKKKKNQILNAKRKVKQALPEINKLKIGGSFVSSTLSGLIGNIAREGLRQPKTGGLLSDTPASLSDVVSQSTGLRPPVANLIAQYAGQQLFDLNQDLRNGYFVYGIDRGGNNPTITIQRTYERGFRNRPTQRIPLQIDDNGNESFTLGGVVYTPDQEEVQEENGRRRFREGEDLGERGTVADIDEENNSMTIRNNFGGTYTVRILTNPGGNQYIDLFGQIIRPGQRGQVGEGMVEIIKEKEKRQKCMKKGKLYSYKMKKCLDNNYLVAGLKRKGMKGGAGAYWNCANTAPSCKKLYKGMKEYHTCAKKKGCRGREISRAEADKRFLEIEEEVKRSNAPIEIIAPSRRGRRRRS
jgi:hypothetical protein